MEPEKFAGDPARSAGGGEAAAGRGRRPVVIYDGHCRFCVDQTRRLERWLGGRAEYASFRSAGTIERFPGLTVERCEAAMQLVLPDGRILDGADAVAQALRLRPLLAPIGWILGVPGIRGLARAAYAAISRRRFRLRGEVCDDDACRVHVPGRAGDARTESAAARPGAGSPR
jgi:predicted DCC family thiol-disulfide oxidoreductase YuxK